jgi:hypothetical protein
MAVAYYHVHLVMNRHFLGPPNGLPLSMLESKNTPIYRGWEEQCSAKILGNELYLCITRTLSGEHLADSAMREAADTYRPSICGHVVIVPLSIDALRRPPPPSTEVFAPCRGVVDSCARCLTDYITTVERRKGRGSTRAKTQSSYWVITITSYHRLGSGRSSSDLQWQMFVQPFVPSARDISRDVLDCAHGEVKATWDSASPENGV